MNVPETRPLFGLEVPTIGEARQRARPGRDNSVSPYRHNLLTVVFYGRSGLAIESEWKNNSSYFNSLIADSEKPS
jgi:hypothetical protein